MPRATIGVSLKTYFGNAQARVWMTAFAARVGSHPAVVDGRPEVFVIPTYLQISDALIAFAGSPVRVGAQDVSAHGPGAFTGEVTARELAEIGVTVAEIGHAERRRLFGETDEIIAAKAAAALEHGITPVVCVGETEPLGGAHAADVTRAQLRAAVDDAPAGRVIVAYEPAWAIGAPAPAPADHIIGVTTALRSALDDLHRTGSAVIYGGSAGPGSLSALGDAVDGLFLGRFAHELDHVIAVLDELPSSAISNQ